MTAIAPHITAFLRERLPEQRGIGGVSEALVGSVLVSWHGASRDLIIN